MKMNTLVKEQTALLNLDPEIILSEQLRKRAKAPILRMLELSR
jgi:quinolinate synthase